MTEQLTGASALLHGDGGTPAGVVGADPAAMSRTEALAERTRLLADPNWKAQFESGSKPHVEQMKSLLTTAGRGLFQFGQGVNPAVLGDLAAQAEGDRAAHAALEAERVVDTLRQTADIPDDVADMVRNNTPVSAAERTWAESQKRLLMRDQTFLERFNKGEREAVSRWTILAIILARPVQQGAA
jgi:hypothetical protein